MKRSLFITSAALALALLCTGTLFAKSAKAATAVTEETQTITTLVPMDASWSYWFGDTATTRPSDNWFDPKFDDSSWKKAQGPLGYGSAKKVKFTYSPITEGDATPYAKTGDAGKVPATFYRTTFTIASKDMVKKVTAKMHYDDAAYVYVNGVLRAKVGAFKADYNGKPFDPIAATDIVGGNATGAQKIGDPVVDAPVQMKASWFTEGKNTIAVVMFQDTGSSSDCLMGLEITATNYLKLNAPSDIAPTVNGAPENQFGLSWISDGNGSDGYVQYIAAGKKTTADTVNWKKAKSVNAEQTGETDFTNKATLTGLKPAQKYFYRVGNDDLWSATGTFTTAEKGYGDGSFTFLDVTDPQGSTSDDFAHWGANIKGALDFAKDASFVVNTGDFVNNGLSPEEWNLFFSKAQDSLMKTMLVPAVGNHEGYDYANSFLSHFNVPVAEKAIQSKGTYYSFNYENAHFTVLNTDEKENEDLSALQRIWLENDLKAASADKNITWRIVLLHRSLYSSGDHSTDGDCINFRTSIGKLLDTYKVDVVLSGHDHVYMRTKPIYNQIGQNPDTVTEDGVQYEVNPLGTVHVIPATISNKNYELNLSADYRILQPAEVAGETYANGRQKLVSYSFLSSSKQYPANTKPNAAAFVKITISKNKLTACSYAVTDGEVAATPFDSFGIIKDSTKPTKEAEKAKKDISAWKVEASASTATGIENLQFEDTVYNAEADFKKNIGTQGDVWYYFFEHNNKLAQLTPMKGKTCVDGTTKAAIETNCLYSEFPNAKNIGNDSVNNGCVRLYDGAFDGNKRPEGERMTLTSYGVANTAEGRDDVVVAWKAPKDGTIVITDWNPEFVGIIPAEKYLNTSGGFRVDIRIKRAASGDPLAAADYEKDSTSILDAKTYDDADGVVSGGAPKLIDKGGPFDGSYTTGAQVHVNGTQSVKKGDYIYFISHCGNNYGWRGVMLDSEIRYVK